MGTCGKVGIKRNDGVVASIVVNHDSYPSWLGKVLLGSYGDYEKADALVSLGDCSFVGNKVAPDEGQVHTFDNPIKDVTIAYHRDRGEDLECDLTDEEEFLNANKGMPWMYLFKDGKWYFKSSCIIAIQEISNMEYGMVDYGDIFISVEQRVAAFNLWRKFTAKNRFSSIERENEYLDGAYRFLYTTASRDFIEFCAKHENMDYDSYCKSLEIDKIKVID